MNMIRNKRASGGPTLKNTYSRSPRVFQAIQKTLQVHGAKSITQDFDAQGRMCAVSFVLSVGGHPLSFRLPARVPNVERIFQKQKGRPLTEQELVQAYQTAWANIRDWVDAQMALIDTQMVEAAEVFLPYTVGPEGRTYFETLKERQFLLEAPRGSESRTRIQEERS